MKNRLFQKEQNRITAVTAFVGSIKTDMGSLSPEHQNWMCYFSGFFTIIKTEASLFQKHQKRRIMRALKSYVYPLRYKPRLLKVF